MPASDHLRLEAAIHRAFGNVMFCHHLAESCEYPGIAEDLALLSAELAAVGEALITSKRRSLRRAPQNGPQMTLDDYPEAWKANGRI